MRLSLRTAINVVVSPSRTITPINFRVDAATMEELRADVTWTMERPYTDLPPIRYRNHCKLPPTYLQQSLREKAALPARMRYEHRWKPYYQQDLGLPLD